jgi:hypothetical protein
MIFMVLESVFVSTARERLRSSGTGPRRKQVVLQMGIVVLCFNGILHFLPHVQMSVRDVNPNLHPITNYKLRSPEHSSHHILNDAGTNTSLP